MLKKIILSIVLLFLIITNIGIIYSYNNNLQHVRVLEDTYIYKSPKFTLSNIIAIAEKGDVFKSVSNSQNNYTVTIITMFSGNGRYIDSLKVYPIEYEYNLPRKEICKEILVLIDDIIRNTKEQAKKISNNNNFDENYNLLIDKNLIELFHQCKINPCEYSKILQSSNN